MDTNTKISVMKEVHEYQMLQTALEQLRDLSETLKMSEGNGETVAHLKETNLVLRSALEQKMKYKVFYENIVTSPVYQERKLRAEAKAFIEYWDQHECGVPVE